MPRYKPTSIDIDALTPERWVLHPGGVTQANSGVAALQEGIEEGGHSADAREKLGFSGKKHVCSG